MISFLLFVLSLYDKGGNIIERIEYAYSTLPADKLTGGVRFDYDYPVSGWKDQLIIC